MDDRDQGAAWKWHASRGQDVPLARAEERICYFIFHSEERETGGESSDKTRGKEDLPAETGG